MLEAKNISVKYGTVKVLSDISLKLAPGSICALVGANGAGKTTLIKALNGTLPLASGEICVDGNPIGSLTRRDVSSRIAVVAQENETRFPITVLEFTLSGRFVHGGAFGWESESDLAATTDALAECELTTFATRLMNQLSGGERQRVVLARAIASGAKILLLDEPTANLDLAHQAMMIRLVRERCRHYGYAAIVITHDLNLASECADEIIMLKGGRIVASGPSEILTVENVQHVFGIDVLVDENPVSRNLRVTAVY